MTTGQTQSYLKDYPRPQLVRREWTDLNGEWEFAFDDRREGETSGWQKGFAAKTKIVVPFTYETKASGIGDETPHEQVWYQRRINIAKKPGKKYLLHLEGILSFLFIPSKTSLVLYKSKNSISF